MRTPHERFIDARDAGNIDEARRIAWDAVVNAPRFYICAWYLGNELASRGDVDGVLYLRALLQRRPDHAKHWVQDEIAKLDATCDHAKRVNDILCVIEQQPAITVAQLHEAFNVYANKQAKLRAQRDVPIPERSTEYFPLRKFDQLFLPAVQSGSIVITGTGSAATLQVYRQAVEALRPPGFMSPDRVASRRTGCASTVALVLAILGWIAFH